MCKSVYVCLYENKDSAVTAQLISAIVFPTCIVQSLFLLNLKFQDPSRLLRLFMTVYVRPGQKPQRPVFLYHGSNGGILNGGQ